MPDWSFLISTGIILIILGFFLLAACMIAGPRAKTEGSGVILIGLIPVVFGTDKRSLIIVILLTIVLMLLAMIFFNNN